MTTQKIRITAEELACLPSIVGRRELIDGEVVEISPAGGRHNQVLNSTAHYLTVYARMTRLGVVLAGDTGVILGRNPDRVRAPDVCLIAAERLPGGRVPSGFLDLVPDLVVEVVSPGDTAAEVRSKREEWLHAGARLAWTIFPDTRTVVAADGPSEPRFYHENQMLPGEPVLPGFKVAVRDLFR